MFVIIAPMLLRRTWSRASKNYLKWLRVYYLMMILRTFYLVSSRFDARISFFRIEFGLALALALVADFGPCMRSFWSRAVRGEACAVSR